MFELAAIVVALAITGFICLLPIVFVILFVKAIINAIRKPDSVPPINDFVYLGQTDRKWTDRPEMDVKKMRIIDKMDRGEIVFVEKDKK